MAEIMRPGDNNFGLIRLLAAASVVTSHSFLISTGDVLSQPLTGLTRYNLGQHAVHVFFVLSGVMVAGSLDRSISLTSFALARGLRIFPGLGVCALFTAFVLGPLVSSLSASSYFGDESTYVYPFRVLTLAKVSASLPGVFGANPFPLIVNDSLWTLKYEAFCYLILALVAFVGAWRSDRAFRTICFLSAIVFIPIGMRLPGPSGASILDSIARFWLCFLIGLLFYRYRARVRLSWYVVAVMAIPWWAGRGSELEPIFTFVVTGYAIMVLANLPTGPLRDLTNSHDLSFGLYIYGWPISQALVWALPGIRPLPLTLASLCVAGLLGWLSWIWVERPSLRARGPLQDCGTLKYLEGLLKPQASRRAEP